MKKVIAFVLAVLVVLPLVGCGEAGKYRKAIQLLNNGEYEDAAALFSELQDYEDCNQYVWYARAKLALEQEEYETAEIYFGRTQGFLDADEYAKSFLHVATSCKEDKYGISQESFNFSNFRFDERGQLLEKHSFQKIESDYTKYEYQYDKAGNLIKKTETRDEGRKREAKIITTYEYDEYGNVTAEHIDYPDWYLAIDHDIYYENILNENHKTEKSTQSHVFPEDVSRNHKADETIEYYGDGKLLRRTVCTYKASGEIRYKLGTEYFYDEHGDLLREEITDFIAGGDEKYITEYTNECIGSLMS